MKRMLFQVILFVVITMIALDKPSVFNICWLAVNAFICGSQFTIGFIERKAAK